jgi:hypothetical protein
VLLIQLEMYIVVICVSVCYLDMVRWLAGGCERKQEKHTLKIKYVHARVGIYLTSAEIGNPLLVWPGSSVRKWKDYSIS